VYIHKLVARALEHKQTSGELLVEKHVLLVFGQGKSDKIYRIRY
jgi:hypothetical protein